VDTVELAALGEEPEMIDFKLREGLAGSSCNSRPNRALNSETRRTPVVGSQHGFSFGERQQDAKLGFGSGSWR